MPEKFIIRKAKTVGMHLAIPEFEESILLELEVDGRVINRVKRNLKTYEQYIRDFYEMHGTRGQVYIIKNSKMNFTSLLKN